MLGGPVSRRITIPAAPEAGRRRKTLIVSPGRTVTPVYAQKAVLTFEATTTPQKGQEDLDGSSTPSSVALTIRSGPARW